MIIPRLLYFLLVCAMIGKLTNEQIEKILRASLIGRIGCHSDGRTYVVPISYAYDGDYIYAHTEEGMKLQMMRSNPNVCFEVDDIHDLSHWSSVIAWGYFQELPGGEEKTRALRVLVNRHLPMVTSATTQLGDNWPFIPNDLDSIPGIVFRIRLLEKTGRFEARG